MTMSRYLFDGFVRLDFPKTKPASVVEVESPCLLPQTLPAMSADTGYAATRRWLRFSKLTAGIPNPQTGTCS